MSHQLRSTKRSNRSLPRAAVWVILNEHYRNKAESSVLKENEHSPGRVSKPVTNAWGAPTELQSIIQIFYAYRQSISENSINYAYNRNILILHYQLTTWKNKMFSYYAMQKTEFGSRGLGRVGPILCTKYSANLQKCHWQAFNKFYLNRIWLGHLSLFNLFDWFTCFKSRCLKIKFPHEQIEKNIWIDTE